MTSDQAPANILMKIDDNSLNQIKDFINESDTIENQNIDKFPPSSPWHFIFSPKIPLWKFDDQLTIRYNLSREKFFPYYFCHIMFMLQYYYFYTVLSNIFSPNNTHRQKVVFYSITFLYILTIICFIKVHFTSPGILPYYWESTKQRIYTKDELRSGIAINHEQKKWGKEHDWPARSFFSGEFGAIILRADHYCVWVGQWIGLKNLKFFIQFLLYSIILAIEFLYVLYNIYQNSMERNIKFVLSLGSSLFFLYHFSLTFVVCLYRISKNYTMVESLLYLDTTYYNKGIRKNFEEIFGSIYLLPLWFLPIDIPLPKDGLDYPYRPNSIALAKNRDENYTDHKR